MQTTKSVRDFSLVIALVVICAFFAIVSPRFLSARNLSLLTTELSITATLAMGMLLVILPGNIDLSAGSGVGLLGGIASVLVFEHNWPAPLAMGAALLTGIFIWFCMGNLIVRQRIPAFIITLGGLLIFKGLFWLVIHNSTIPIVQGGRANLYSVLTTFYLPPVAGYALATLIVVALVLAKLRARKALQAYGFAVAKLMGRAGFPACSFPTGQGARSTRQAGCLCYEFERLQRTIIAQAERPSKPPAIRRCRAR